MHRFKTRRKGKTEDDIPPVPKVKKGKKGEPLEEHKPAALDLGSALPPSDDFRTSLLMPNLANRFSILKQEQAAAAAAAAAAAENQNGAGIGEATSYDPGFQPARYNGLGDIAETASLQGSLSNEQRARIAGEEEDRNEDGSIMNRARHGESNNLFGGRQKVYRVPASKLLRETNSMEDIRVASVSPFGGRLAYDSDVPASTFNPRRPSRIDTEVKHMEEEVSPVSPISEVPELDKDRMTISSTNSFPRTTLSRSSTAATSINSQGGHSPAIGSGTTPSAPQSPTFAKPRRPLYEQALDQQMQDHQTSAMGRLERLASMRRTGTASPTPRSNSPLPIVAPLSPSRSQGSLKSPVSPISHTGFPWGGRRPTPAETPEETHEEQDAAAETKVVSPPETFASFDFGLSPASSKQDPLSPPMSSKAAEFPFKDPISPKFQNSRRSPPASLKIDRPVSPISERASTISLDAVGGPAGIDNELQNALSPLPDNDEDEAGSTFLSTPTASEASFAEKERMVEEMEKELDAELARKGSVSKPAAKLEIESSELSDDDSDSSSGRFIMVENDESPKPVDPISPKSPKSPIASLRSADEDSPTLPPGGLSAMVRQHLRSDSDTSSVYASSTYTRMSRVSRYGFGTSAAPSQVPSMYVPKSATRASGSSAGNMWQYEDMTQEAQREHEREQREQEQREQQEQARRDEEAQRERELEQGNIRSSSPTSIYTIQPPRRIYDEAPPSLPSSRPGSRQGRNETREDWESVRERSLSRAGAAPQDRDWEEKLAYRKQMIQQTLQNQAKMQSMYETDDNASDREEKPRNIIPRLGKKGSNGYLGHKAVGVLGTEPSGPTLDGRRSRSNSTRSEEQRLRNAVRGPHPMPPPPPVHQHPALQKASSFDHAGRRGPPLRIDHLTSPSVESLPRSAPGQLLPTRSPLQKLAGDIRERSLSTVNTPQSEHSQYFSVSSTPSSTNPSTPLSARPRMNNPRAEVSHDDLSKAMMTGTSTVADASMHIQRPNRGRERRLPDGSTEPVPVKSEFEMDSPKMSTFRRVRGLSNASSTPNALSRKASEEPPMLPEEDAMPSHRVSDSPSSSAGSMGGPAPEVIQNAAATIKAANANSSFAPARKRAVSKAQIGEPRLLSSTSQVPTVTLDVAAAKTAGTLPPFAVASPTGWKGSAQMGFPDEEQESPARNRKSTSRKLRKSVSDGGGLRGRNREADRREMERMPMPKGRALIGAPMPVNDQRGVAGMI